MADIKDPKVINKDTKGVKDANDWLQAMAAEGVQHDEQVEMVRDRLNQAPTMVETVAKWAGKQKGSDQDAAFKTAFEVIASMEKVARAKYRTILADGLGIGLREFNDITKAASADSKNGSERIDVRETLGGYIDGWLIEYVYEPEEGSARLAFRDPEGKIGVADYIDMDEVRYAPKPPGNFIKDGGVLFSSDLGPLKETRELVAIVESFIHQHYLLETDYLGRIIAYYVMMTWVYDSFNALPYLRALGEAGAGKSELMRRIGHVCYRMMTASGANTAASFFRATEMYKGTVFIDEADLHDGGDMSNDIVKFLNLGAMRGNPIWRLEEVVTDNGKSFEPATFQTFCPKLIAQRKEFRDDAVGSRSLTIKLMSREPIELKAKGIRLYIDGAFRQKALKIRNLLLRWRLEKWKPEIDVSEEHMDLDISSRLNQVTMPLKALAQDDESLMDEIVKFLRQYNMEIVLSRSMTIGARIVEALWKIYCYPDLRKLLLRTTQDGEKEYIMIGDVRRIANEIMDEMNRPEGEPADDDGDGPKRKKDELSARGVGAVIRNELQLQVGQRRGSGYPVFWDQLKMEALAKRYGVDVEELERIRDKKESKQDEIPF